MYRWLTIPLMPVVALAAVVLHFRRLLSVAQMEPAMVTADIDRIGIGQSYRSRTGKHFYFVETVCAGHVFYMIVGGQMNGKKGKIPVSEFRERVVALVTA